MKSFESLYLLILWTLIGFPVGQNISTFPPSIPYDICKHKSDWNSVRLLPENAESLENSQNSYSTKYPGFLDFNKQISISDFCNPNSTIPLKRRKRETCNFMKSMMIRSAITGGIKVLEKSDRIDLGTIRRGPLTLEKAEIRGLSTAFKVREEHLMCFGNSVLVTIIMGFPYMNVNFIWRPPFLGFKNRISVVVTELVVYLLVSIKMNPDKISQMKATILETDIFHLGDLKVKFLSANIMTALSADLMNTILSGFRKQMIKLIEDTIKNEMNKKFNAMGSKTDSGKNEKTDKNLAQKAKQIAKKEKRDFVNARNKVRKQFIEGNPIQSHSNTTDEYDQKWKMSIIREMKKESKKNNLFHLK